MQWIIELLKKSSLVTTELLVSSFLINLLGLASSIFVIQVYGRYLIHGIDGTLITLTSGMIIVILMEYLLRNLRYELVAVLTVNRDSESSGNLFQTFLHAQAEELMRIKSGLRQSLLGRHEQMQSILNPSFFISIIDAPFALLYLIAIFFISTFIGWSVLVLLIMVIIISFGLSLRVKNYTQKQLEFNMSQSSFGAAVEQFEMIRANGAGTIVQQKWQENANEARRYKYLIAQQQHKIQTINQTLAVFLSVIVISLGAREVVAGNIDFGLLIGMNILAARALALVTRPATALAPLLRVNQTKQAVDDFLKIPVKASKGIEPKQFATHLELKNISYGYGKGPVIERLNVIIPKGSFVKIIGNNGAGKTTLSRLLVGLLNPKAGMVLADGTDIRQLKPSWWQQQLIYMPQEPQFINASLKENLTVLNPDISDEQLAKIIASTDLHDFVSRSEDGLDMQIVDGGLKLALGIRRRLSLARALVSNGSIVIMDEPTDGLDDNGIQAIAKLINEMIQQHRTVIVLTHDESLIKGEAILIDLNHKPQA